MRWARTHPLSGPVREGGRDFKSRRPDELTRWARAGWLLEQVSLPEAGTISGDIRKAPGFLKGPAGPLSRAPRLGSSGGFFGFFASRPQNTARCKNQRKALVPLFMAPEPGPLGGPPIFGQKGTYPGHVNLSRQPQSHPRVPTTLESVLQPWRSVGVRLASQFSCSASHWFHAAWLRMAVPVS